MGGTYGPLPKVMLMAVLLVIWSEKDIHDRANIQDCWWAPCASWEDLLLVGFMLISWVYDFIIWFYGLQNHILFEIYLTYYGIPWWWTTHERTLNHSSGLSSLLDEQRQQGCLNNGDTKLADLISTTWKPKTIAWTPWIFWVMLALGFWDAYETSVPICFFKNDVWNLEKVLVLTLSKSFLVFHLRLAIAIILLGDYVNGWVCHFGLKCSTFSTMNCGTSGRTPCTPYGNFHYKSVLEGNLLASRILGKFITNDVFFL